MSSDSSDSYEDEFSNQDKEYLEFIDENKDELSSGQNLDGQVLNKLKELLKGVSSAIPSEKLAIGYNAVVSSLSFQLSTIEEEKESFEKDKKALEDDKSAFEEEKYTFEEDKLNFEVDKQTFEDEKQTFEEEKESIEKEAEMWKKEAEEQREKVFELENKGSEDSDKESLIKELSNRLSLAGQQREADNEKSSDVVIEQGIKIGKLETEISDLKHKLSLNDIEIKSTLRIFSEEFGAAEAKTASDVISAFRRFLGISNEETSTIEHLQKLMSRSEALQSIIDKFELDCDVEKAEEALEEKFDETKDDLRDQINEELNIEGSTEEIIKKIKDIVSSNEKLQQALEDAEQENTIIDSPIKERGNDELLEEERKRADDLEDELLELEEKIRSKDTELLNVEKQLAQTQIELTQRIDELTTLKAENINLKQSLDDAISKLKNSNGEYDDMKDDIKALTENKSVMTKKTEKLQKRIKELEEQLAEQTEEKDRLDSELIETQLKFEKLQYEVEEMKDQKELEVPESKDSEEKYDQFIEAISSVADQLHDQMEELSNEERDKSTLISAIYKQQKMLTIYDERISQLKKELETNKRENTEEISNEIIGQMISRFVDLSEHKETEKYVSELQEIATGKGSLSDRVLSLVSKLVLNLTQLATTTGRTDSQIAETNRRLLGFIHSEIGFIQRLVADAQEEEKDEDEIQVLRVNIEKCQKFVEDNCEGITEENFLIDFLDDDCDPMKLADTFDKIIDNYGEPEDCDPKELFAALCQCVAVNSVMRNFASRRHDLCSQQLTEIKALRIESKTMQEDITSKYEGEVSKLKDAYDEEKARREEAEEALQSTLGILRSHVDDEQSTRFVLRAIEEGSQHDIENEKYNRDIEAKLEKTLAELELSRKELEESKEQSQMQIAELDDDKAKQFDDLVAENEVLKEENEKLKENIRECIEEIENLKEDIKDKEEEIEDERKQREMAEKENEINKNDFEIKLKEYEEDSALKYKKKEELIKENAKAKKQMIKEDLRVKEAEISRLKDQLSEKERRIQSLEAFKKELMADQRKKSSEYRKNELENIQALQKLRKELSELKSKAAAAELDSKLAKCRLKTAEETAARDRSKYESKLAMQSITQETSLRQKSELIKKEREENEREFLVNICHMFKEYADFSQPIDKNSVSALLNRVHVALNKSNEDAANAIPGNISKIVFRLRESQKSLECWQKWAHDVCNKEGSDEELMKYISKMQESAILAE